MQLGGVGVLLVAGEGVVVAAAPPRRLAELVPPPRQRDGTRHDAALARLAGRGGGGRGGVAQGAGRQRGRGAQLQRGHAVVVISMASAVTDLLVLGTWGGLLPSPGQSFK